MILLIVCASLGVSTLFLGGLHLFEQGVQALEVALPKAAIAIEPGFELLERRGSQRIDSALRVDADIDEAGVAQNTQVLGYLRLAETKTINEVANGAWSVEQQLNDVKAIGLGQRSKGF
jgi:hypothetical protein